VLGIIPEPGGHLGDSQRGSRPPPSPFHYNPNFEDKFNHVLKAL
jgi:hypothetical protein